ncbi:MAG: hypothetical protein MUC51_17485 [Anaerolineae bacterium]|nr:hypothetical protein [Anaerolineae bacterium]
MIGAYELPHACETAEVTALLSKLSPRRRRVLRAYVHQVEFGEQGVSDWLRSEKCPVHERAWYGKNYRGDPAFMAALAGYRDALQQWYLRSEARQVEQAQRLLRLAAQRSAQRLIEHADGNIGQFFTLQEYWTDDPLPTAEILEEEYRLDEALGIKRKMYRVRRTAFDAAALADPKRARLIKKFTDSPRSGLSIELYDAQRATESILDRADPETASKDQPPAASVLIYLPENGRDDDQAAAGAAGTLPGNAG